MLSPRQLRFPRLFQEQVVAQGRVRSAGMWAGVGAGTAEGWIRDIGHSVATEQSALCSHPSSATQASQSHCHQGKVASVY